MARQGRKGEDFNGYGRLGDTLFDIGVRAGDLPGDVILAEVRLKITTDEGVEQMAVVKAWVDGVQAVGFVTAPALDTLVHLVCAKLMNGSMKWREDKPYEAR